MKIDLKFQIVILIIAILVSCSLGYFAPKLITNYRTNLAQIGYQQGIKDVVSNIEANGFVIIPLIDENGQKANLKLVQYEEKNEN